MIDAYTAFCIFRGTCYTLFVLYGPDLSWKDPQLNIRACFFLCLLSDIDEKHRLFFSGSELTLASRHQRTHLKKPRFFSHRTKQKYERGADVDYGRKIEK